MEYVIFLTPFLISFSVSVLLLIFLLFLQRSCNVCDTRISDRHVHKSGVSRFGGIAIITSFLIAIFFNRHLVVSVQLLGVLIASIAILLLGVFDDIRQVSWKIQLFFQVLIVLFVYSMGVRLEYISNPFGGIFLFASGVGYMISLLLSVGWVIFLMNAINWIDGTDGVAGGVSLIGGTVIFLLSLRPEVNQPPVAIILASFMGGLVAFLIMNFHPAKILAGTSGAMFMGFILAIMAIFAGAKIATTLLVLAVPIVDALWVIGERYKTGNSIFSSDRRHLHFKLIEMGWSIKKISFFYWGITIIVAVISLNTGAVGKAITFLLFVAFACGIFIAIRKKINNVQM
jgi:UDP-GlcNAc:undecaprenyl-phosphate GlcNAc-1-phosphate transferase